jgi:hypothetical protein
VEQILDAMTGDQSQVVKVVLRIAPGEGISFEMLLHGTESSHELSADAELGRPLGLAFQSSAAGER